MTSHEVAGTRCVFIGDESLAAQCAMLASSAGLSVEAVASRNPQVLQLADDAGLPTLDTGRLAPGVGLAEALRAYQFDVLISAAYLRILPDDVLEQATTCLNFHDGPLPTYAGLNVTTWAIHRGETTHAVNWHLMTADVDGGDIVATRTFSIDSDETAFSLNAKCFEHGVESFRDVARGLASGSLEVSKQLDGERGTYLRRRRPPSVLDPTAAAEATARTARALDVGPRVVNGVGCLRLVLGDDVVVIGSVSTSAAPDGAATGTVTEVGSGQLSVATVDGQVHLTELVDPDGLPADVSELASRHGLAVGEPMATPDDGRRATLAELDAALADHEPWWTTQLAHLEAVTPPVFVSEPAASASAWVEQPVGDTTATADQVVAATAIWASSVSGTDQTVIELTSPSVRRSLADIAPLARPPVIQLPGGSGLRASDVEAIAHDAIATVTKRGPFLRDVVARHPDLRGRPLAPAVRVDVDVDDRADATLDDALSLRVVHHSDGRVNVAYRAAEAAGPRIAEQLSIILGQLSADPSGEVADLELVGALDREILDEFNRTDVEHDRELTVDEQVRRQVHASPAATAVSSGGRSVTYEELWSRVETLASRLVEVGVGRGDTVGIALDRGIDMVVAVLAVLDRGANYLPLDPTYPQDRLQFMVADSGCQVAIGGDAADAIGLVGLTLVRPDETGDATLPARSHDPADLAYTIYTSGSTGTPKGVQLEHRQVSNFFVAMDDVIDHDHSDGQLVWLAVTSLSFDISVLELLWTLARGFHVVVKQDSGFRVGAEAAPNEPAAPTRRTSMSLFYFAADAAQASDGYRLLLDSAKWADEHGFEAVWTPERHFHDFGAPYPNPSVVSAALAVATNQIQIRAGSVVLPLHNAVRVAEEWAIVDNLSGGRVGISFAAGWQPNDFVLNPDAYATSKESLPTLMDTVQRLWRGETLSLPGPKGDVTVHTLPRPVQAELPTWLTSAGSTSTFERAGTAGLNLLTHLLGQSVEQLADNIAVYRAARRAAGHEGDGHVTLMLHTYLADDSALAHDVAREPLKGYLGTAAGLLKDFATAFPIFAKAGKNADEAFRSLTDDEMSQLLDMAAARYLTTSGLFGTVDDATEMAEAVAAAGADEIACLIDFGIDTEKVMASLDLLGELHDRLEARNRRLAEASAGEPSPAPAAIDETVAGLVAHYGVTHLQCTPSLASMLVANPPDRASMRSIRHLMLGGEALPVALATELRELLPERFTNMYGPTETTIWSLVHEIDEVPGSSVPIGHAIANTTLHVLDASGRQLPVGSFGELHIGGEGVARGYHDRTELTASRFVDRPGLGRVYATGDVVRMHPDGYVEFGGRADNQVKIRGHRIELGEIESVIDEHPSVSRSVVIAHGDGEPQLVGFVVGRDGTSPDAEALRRHVGDQLPDAMVPSAIGVLDELPLTPNGKIDRKRLPLDRLDAPSAIESAAAPAATDAESTVASIWIDELGRAVGRDDNFFEIGGHSLLAVKVFRRLTETTGAELALTDVFRFPTVRTFAEHLESLSAGAGDNGQPADQPDVPERAGTSRGAMRRRALQRRGGD